MISLSRYRALITDQVLRYGRLDQAELQSLEKLLIASQAAGAPPEEELPTGIAIFDLLAEIPPSFERHLPSVRTALAEVDDVDKLLTIGSFEMAIVVLDAIWRRRM